MPEGAAAEELELGISGFSPSADELVVETSDAAGGSVLAAFEVAIVRPLSDGTLGFVGARASADEFVVTLPDAAGISVVAPAAAGVIFRVVPLFSNFCWGNSEIGPRALADDTVVGLTDAVTPFVLAP
jgi:hypothetical protein